MITTETFEIVTTKTVTTYACDFCDFVTKGNNGCCGWHPVMKCNVCGKDICGHHREFFSDDPEEDYPSGVMACPNCEPTVREFWYDLDGNVDLTIELAKEELGIKEDEDEKTD